MNTKQKIEETTITSSIQLRPNPLSGSDIIEKDQLNRKPIIDRIERLLIDLNGPTVISLESEWGTGKTTFLEMLKNQLEEHNHPVIMFDCWKDDYSNDPLPAILDDINTHILKYKEHLGEKVIDKVNEVFWKIAISLANPFAALAAQQYGLDPQLIPFISPTIEAVEECAKSKIEDKFKTKDQDTAEYQSPKDLLTELKNVLSEVLEKIEEAGGQKLCIFFDELDRCQPQYALRLLERVKHVFDTPNISFVLSFAPGRLESSIKHIYGEGFTLNDFLEKIVDYQFTLPKVSPTDALRLANHSLVNLNVRELISDRLPENIDINMAMEDLAEMHVKLSSEFGLSIRAGEKLIHRFVAISTFLKKEVLYIPHLMLLLTALYQSKPEFLRLIHDETLRSLSRSNDFQKFLLSFDFDVQQYTIGHSVPLTLSKLLDLNLRGESYLRERTKGLSTARQQGAKEEIIHELMLEELILKRGRGLLLLTKAYSQEILLFGSIDAQQAVDRVDQKAQETKTEEGRTGFFGE